MITIVGAGKFGTAVSKLLRDNKHNLVDIAKNGTYSKKSIEKIKNSDKLIICVPSDYLPNCLVMLKPLLRANARVLSCTKGLYENLKTPTELIKEKLNVPAAALIGPNLSTEIIAGAPAITSISGDYAKEWAQLFSSKDFSVIIGEDSSIFEFGGAVKNVVALGVGLLKGYYQENYYNIIGAFIASILKEMNELYGREIVHPIFIGDLFSTAMSETSRNYKFGFSTGALLRSKAEAKEPAETVEGYNTLRVIHSYIDKRKLKAPLTKALYDIFFQKGKVTDLIFI